jgi:hypothetical protein
MFDSLKKSLGNATDSETAKAAAAEIKSLGGSADKLGESISKLPEAAKTAISTVIEHGLNSIQPMIDKVNAMPVVADVIKPELDALLKKLKGLTGT